MTLSEGHTNMPLLPAFNRRETKVGQYLAKQWTAIFNLLTGSKEHAGNAGTRHVTSNTQLNYADDAEAIAAAELAARFTDQE